MRLTAKKSMALVVLSLAVLSCASKAGEPMDEKRFWQLIETARDSTPGYDLDAAVAQADALADALAKLPANDIARFNDILHAKLREAYRWDVWGAAYLLNGGCSDDGFLYFRAWLVGRGRTVYEAALADPDTLAAFAQSPYTGAVLECEDLLHAPTVAHLKSGAKGAPPGFARGPGGEPRGTRWEEEDLGRLFPKIFAKLMLP